MKFTVELIFVCVLVACMSTSATANCRWHPDNDDRIPRLNDDETELVRRLEQQRIQAIAKVMGSVVAIYDDDRGGGGSGVIIDPTGIALTNHHVIMGAGVEGWGGLADGNLYRWKLVGTDPGGDVSIIQLEGDKPFPFTPLGNSDSVRVGDWALAMGNPFILTEDQKPTVTLGIVSGVKRYQPGAGKNQLVYGNCIQVDSSINPGNSGGPLFNLDGEVIGINGRGSFQARGRVNVGLGYAISSNQIKNFIPDLLATKLVEHATIDANFGDRGGRVICETINQDSIAAKAGLDLGDELLEFEGIPIRNAHQYTNLICTLPEGWPVQMKVRKPEGDIKQIVVRALGLPYAKPRPRPVPKQDEKNKRTPEQEKQIKRQQAMIKLLSATPGTIRHSQTNQKYAELIASHWRKNDSAKPAGDAETPVVLHVQDSIRKDDKEIGKQSLWLASNGQFRAESQVEGQTETFLFDGKQFARRLADGDFEKLSTPNAKLEPAIVQAVSMIAPTQPKPFSQFGKFLIAGGDKADGQNAYRMKTLDNQDDWFYFWLRMYGPDGRPAPRILKASANKDCDHGNGGVIFDDWKSVDGWRVPHVRKNVVGLSEEIVQTFVATSADVIHYDANLFQAETGNADAQSKQD